jgi:hypothetical protein
VSYFFDFDISFSYAYYIYAYLWISLFFSFIIIQKESPPQRLITFIILAWFFFTPVVRTNIFARINPFIAITGRYWKIDGYLTVFLLIYVIINYLKNKNKLKVKKRVPIYEIFLYLFFIIQIVVIYIHKSQNTIGGDLVKQEYYLLMQSLLLYYALAKVIDKEMIFSLFEALKYMAIISTVFGILQFFIDPWIMKTGPVAVAFSNYKRMTGIFPTAHDHALVTLLAILLLVFKHKDTIIRNILIGFLSFGILLNFSRGSWLAVISIFFVFMISFKTKLLLKYLKYFIVATAVFFVLVYAYLPEDNLETEIKDSNMVKERIATDTATQRIDLYKIASLLISEHWAIGIGDRRNNELFYTLMFPVGGKDWAMGKQGGMHNIILKFAVLKGIFVALLFLLFNFSFFYYCHKKSKKENSYVYLIPYFYSLAFLIYMQTAAGYLNIYGGRLAVYLMAIVAAIRYNGIDTSTFVLEKKKDDQ